MMKIVSRGIISKPLDDENLNSNTFPCIEILPSGRWLAAFRAAKVKGDCEFQHAVMTWSDDEGKTWVKPFEPIKLPDINGKPGQSRTRYFLSTGGSNVLMVCDWVDSSELNKPYYNPEHESLKDTRIFFCFSEDNGETWSSPELMNTNPIEDPVPLTGAPFILDDGTIVCQFEVNKHDWDTSKWIHKSAMIFSRDGGRSWGEVVKVTEKEDMYYWDQRPNVVNGTSIVDFFWTMDGKRQEYLNIHARESLNGGISWGEVWDTGIYGQPGQPVGLSNGLIATIDIDRSASPIITVRISSDNGRSYNDKLVIYSNDKLGKQDSKKLGMNEAWSEMVRFSVGHPTLLNLGNSQILAYYYAGVNPNNTHIEFVKIQLFN